MITRPKQFSMASAGFLLMAISFPVQVMFLYGHPVSESAAILSKITWMNWLVILGFLAASYLYFHASRWLVVCVPVVIGLVAINNYFVGQFAGDFSLLQTSVATLLVGLFFVPLLMPSSRVLLRDPKRRWWRRSKRVHKRVSATINPFVGDMIQSHTFDVSQTGAFVCTSGEEEELPKVGDMIRLSLNVNSMKKIRCEAVVVRIVEAKGSYPSGMGLKILEVKKEHQRSFDKFLHSNDYTH